VVTMRWTIYGAGTKGKAESAEKYKATTIPGLAASPRRARFALAGGSRLNGRGPPPKQLIELRADVRRSHESFTNQHGPDVGCLQAFEIGAAADAALADQADVARQLVDQLQGVL